MTVEPWMLGAAFGVLFVTALLPLSAPRRRKRRPHR